MLLCERAIGALTNLELARQLCPTTLLTKTVVTDVQITSEATKLHDY